MVAPREVAPNDFEALGVSQTIDEHTYGYQEEGYTDKQAFAHGALVDVEEVSGNQACRAQSGVATCNGSGNNAEYRQDSTNCPQPFFWNVCGDGGSWKHLARKLVNNAILLEDIVEARINEILDNVAHQIALSGYENKLLAGAVITGGGIN